MEGGLSWRRSLCATVEESNPFSLQNNSPPYALRCKNKIEGQIFTDVSFLKIADFSHYLADYSYLRASNFREQSLQSDS